MAAELVKSCKRQTVKLNSWISVPGTYFDDDKTKKFYGMILSQFDDAVLVKWEDGYSTRVDLDDITLEPDYLPSCNSKEEEFINNNIIENIKTEPKAKKAKNVKRFVCSARVIIGLA